MDPRDRPDLLAFSGSPSCFWIVCLSVATFVSPPPVFASTWVRASIPHDLVPSGGGPAEDVQTIVFVKARHGCVPIEVRHNLLGT